jgi:type IV secretion system protein VirB9
MSLLSAIPVALGAAAALTAADTPSGKIAGPGAVPGLATAAVPRPPLKRVGADPAAARSSVRAPWVPTPAIRRVAAASRTATLEPGTGGYINAIQVYPYSEGAIYHVYTAPEQVTDIALQPGETLGAVAAGDTVRWIIGDTSSGSGGSKRTHVLVKPFTAGLATTAVITTDRRTYHVALTSTAHVAMVALSWTYPQDQLIALRKAAEQARASLPVANGLQLDQLHFNYAISGDQPAWRPLRAFDDGRQTFIEFPPSLEVGEAPPLFLLDDKGQAQLVNYRVEGRFYVVDRLFDAAELRLGLKHQDIVRISHVADAGASRRAS